MGQIGPESAATKDQQRWLRKAKAADDGGQRHCAVVAQRERQRWQKPRPVHHLQIENVTVIHREALFAFTAQDDERTLEDRGGMAGARRGHCARGTQSCPPAFNEANLIVEILNFADSETGSWNNSAALNQCIDDPSYYIQGVQLDCPTCDESGLTVVDPTCETIDETAGVVVVTPSGIGPWNYIWFNLVQIIFY